MAIDYQGPEGSVRYDAPPVDPQTTQAQGVPQWTQQATAAAAATAQQPMYGNGAPMAPGVPAPGAYTPMYVTTNPYAQAQVQFQPAPATAVFNGPQPTMQAEPPQAFQQPQAGPFTGAYANTSPGTQASQMAWAQQAGQPAMQQVAVYAPKSKTTAGVLGLVFGALGAHNFYLGKTGRGIAQLLITLLTGGVLAPVSAIWGLVEGICILASSPGSSWAKDGRGHDLI